MNVLQNTEKIAAGERLDEGVTAVVRVAATLHDISVFECEHAIHGRVSAEIAEKHLSEHGFPGDFVTRVSRAIAEHGSDLDTLTPVQMSERFSLEGKVLIEADILDKLGASAITNALLVQGQRGSLSFECRAALEDGKAMQRAAFFKDYLWTETAKRMAENRFSFFRKFLDQLSEEVVKGSSPPGFSA